MVVREALKKSVFVSSVPSTDKKSRPDITALDEEKTAKAGKESWGIPENIMAIKPEEGIDLK